MFSSCYIIEALYFWCTLEALVDVYIYKSARDVKKDQAVVARGRLLGHVDPRIIFDKGKM